MDDLGNVRTFNPKLTWEQLRAPYNLTGEPLRNLRSSCNIVQTQDAAVIAMRERGLAIGIMHWGLVPAWVKDIKIGSSLINARLERLPKSPPRNAFDKRRCLVPASGYYEWLTLPGSGGVKPRKQPFYLTRKDSLPLPSPGCGNAGMTACSPLPS